MNTFFKPTAFARWELAVMRILFALVIWDAIPESMTLNGVPKPIGVAMFVPEWVIAFGKAVGTPWFQVSVVLLLVFFALGTAPILTTPLLLVVTTMTGTLNNSQGAITHHLQIVSLVLLAQSVCLIFELVRRRKWKVGLLGMPLDREIWVAYATQQAVVASYVVSAWTKLKESGFDWFVNAARFPIQIKKNTRMAYYNELEEPGSGSFVTDLPSKIELLLVQSPNLCRVVIGSGLVLELAVILALAGRAWAFAFGLMLLMFHSTISAVMGLDFKFNSYLLCIYFIFPGLAAAIVHWSRAQTRRNR